MKQLLIAIFSIVVISIHAQTGLSGVITDPSGPIFGVTILVTKDSQIVAGAVSDFDGRYEVLLSEGFYTVRFEAFEFGPKTFFGVAVEAKKLNRLDLKFTEADMKKDLIICTFIDYWPPLITDPFGANRPIKSWEIARFSGKN